MLVSGLAETNLSESREFLDWTTTDKAVLDDIPRGYTLNPPKK
jgi:hypothetical protein